MTFDQLYAACLGAAGEAYTEVGESVQYRIIRSVVDDLSLTHYRLLKDRPGFIQVLQELINLLKASRVWPDTFLNAVAVLGEGPRIRELGQAYAAYQARLQEYRLADRAGLGWVAAEALEMPGSNVAFDWPLLIVDGFDSFTEVQVAVLKILAERVDTFIVTLTGPIDEGEQRPVYQRFAKSRQRLERALDVQAETLPHRTRRSRSLVLAHLEANLFTNTASQENGASVVTLIEAPDRAGEVRAALRWLKEQLVGEGLPPDESALLARNLEPYRPFIVETAAEFRLPIRLVDGLPLRSNPAVASLLDLLRLALPQDGTGMGLALPRQSVVNAWRSPYFDWASALAADDDPEPIDITPGDAETLDRVARQGRVIGGQSQWQEVLGAMRGRATMESGDVEERRPEGSAAGGEAWMLEEKFARFLNCIMPPQGLHSYRYFVGWLETLIGPDPAIERPNGPDEEPASLNVVARARDAESTLAKRDVAALHALKEILRSLDWAETGAIRDRNVDYTRFLAELVGAIEATSYRPPATPGSGEILVADVIQARGLPLRIVAILGLAEGEFPATQVEDPFLRETDRLQMREAFKLPLESSIESAEREFFYEAITRPWENLLLTRPRLTDSGAEWLPSPFWEEVRRLVEVRPIELTTDSVPTPGKAASLPELTESLAVYPDFGAARRWVEAEYPKRWAALAAAGRIFRDRYANASTPFDGDLTTSPETFAHHFRANYPWSPSGLESYRACPFSFFVSRVLGVAPRLEPVEGLDAAQSGTIYHRILEALYEALDPVDRTDLERLLGVLPAVARRILDQAPRREGFRETAWWRQTRQEIVTNIARSVQALSELGSEFVPIRLEARFLGDAALIVTDQDDHFRLHGVIDRVDQNLDGGLRVIDYKTSGPYGYDARALDRGEKLQLPLYALAARDALALGEPVDGFYWHIRQAEASKLQLGSYGSEEAIQVAVEYAWGAVRSARRGHFVPQPPLNGCPDYCPAVSFCWRYRSRGGR